MEFAGKWQAFRNPFLRPVAIQLTTVKEVCIRKELLCGHDYKAVVYECIVRGVK